MSTGILVSDPTGLLNDGTILEPNAAQVARSKGASVLPIVPDLLSFNGISGWAKRSFGAGERFETVDNRRRCPIWLYVVPKFTVITWAARVVPVPREGEPNGRLKLALDSGRPGSLKTGLVMNDAPTLIHTLDPDDRGGWTIGGTGQVNPTSEGFLALGLYGVLRGAAVQWLAVSQS